MTDGTEPTNIDAPASHDRLAVSRQTFWAGRGPRGLALAAAALSVGGVAVVTLRGGNTDAPRYIAVVDDRQQQTTSIDPLMIELLRCRSVPPQVNDGECEQAWDENRRRFFGESTPVPGASVRPDAPIRSER